MANTFVKVDDPRPEIWILPEHMDKCIMIMVRTDDPVQMWGWNAGLHDATKTKGGFRQINSPICGISCNEHWTCPGMYGWELFGFHGVSFEIIMMIFQVAQEKALKLIEEW